MSTLRNGCSNQLKVVFRYAVYHGFYSNTISGVLEFTGTRSRVLLDMKPQLALPFLVLTVSHLTVCNPNACCGFSISLAAGGPQGPAHYFLVSPKLVVIGRISGASGNGSAQIGSNHQHLGRGRIAAFSGSRLGGAGSMGDGDSQDGPATQELPGTAGSGETRCGQPFGGF